MQRVHMHAYMLARTHAGQLRLLEVGGDPQIIGLHDHEQLLAFGDARANLSAALGDHPGDRSGNAAVTKIEAALFECRLGSLDVRLLALDIGLTDSHLQGRAALGLL